VNVHHHSFWLQQLTAVWCLLLQGGTEGSTFIFRTTWRLRTFLTQITFTTAAFETEAAYGSLKPPPTRRLRRALLHLSYSMTLSRLLDTITPASRVELDFVVQQGSFAPQALPCFLATANLAATVSSSFAFPVAPVIRSTLLHRFLAGTRTVSPVARHALVTVLPLPPRRSDISHQSACETSCCLRPTIEGSAFGVIPVEATCGFTLVAAR
jgi:hypothetical protein